MSDRLKFKAWHEKRQTMEDIQNLYWFEENGVREDGDNGYKIIQCLGERDITGQLIFEGDIYRSGERVVNWDTREVKPSYSVIKFKTVESSSHGHGFSESSIHYGYTFGGHYGLLPKDLKVVGNIYQNPKLLEAS